ncbi:hypothetical protein ACLOJK_026074 [Asimina triloba]
MINVGSRNMAERGTVGQPEERQLEERVSLLEQRMAGLVTDTEHEEMMAKLESLSDEVAVLKRAFLESGGRGEGRNTKGAHFAKDCLKNEKVSALVIDEEHREDTPTRVNLLQLLNAITHEGIQSSGLMYVPIVLNGHEVQAMVDTGWLEKGSENLRSLVGEGESLVTEVPDVVSGLLRDFEDLMSP